MIQNVRSADVEDEDRDWLEENNEVHANYMPGHLVRVQGREDRRYNVQSPHRTHKHKNLDE